MQIRCMLRIFSNFKMNRLIKSSKNISGEIYFPYRFTRMNCSIKNKPSKFSSKFTSCSASRKPATLLKQTLAQIFPCEFCKVFRNTYFIEYLPTARDLPIIGNNHREKIKSNSKILKSFNILL